MEKVTEEGVGSYKAGGEERYLCHVCKFNASSNIAGGMHILRFIVSCRVIHLSDASFVRRFIVKIGTNQYS